MFNSNDPTYSLPLAAWSLSHTDDPALLLLDGDEPEGQDLAAFVRSGDYLDMLATRLDAISENLHPDNEAEAAIIQHFVNDLLSLGRTHKIVKK